MQGLTSSRLAAASLRVLRSQPEVQAPPLLQSAFAGHRSFHASRRLREENKKVDEPERPRDFTSTLQGSTFTRLQRERANENRYIRERQARKKEWIPNTFGLSLGVFSGSL